MDAQPGIHFTHRERVRWVDTDASRRIHFTAMFRYFAAAEQEFFRSLGFNHKGLSDLGIDIPRVAAECNYRAPVVHDELLDIEVHVERVGKSSVTLSYTARKQNGVVGADGRITFCAIDPTTGRPAPLPEQLRWTLESAARG